MPDTANRSNSQELRLRNLDFSPYIQDDIKITPKLTVNLGLRWDIQVPFTENNNLIVFFNPNSSESGSWQSARRGNQVRQLHRLRRITIGQISTGATLDRASALPTRSTTRWWSKAGFSVAFLNGGAYEYGTSKVAVNYGNLLVGSFTRGSTGGTSSSYGSWDTNITAQSLSRRRFSPSLGVGTQINDFSKNDGFAPYSQQWNVNVQRELPYNTFVTAAWVGNRVIHLPSQLNTPNQLDPASILVWVPICN